MASTGWGDITLPGLTGFGAGRYTGNVILPLHTLEATGSVGSTGTLEVDLPIFTVDGRSGAVARMELPALTLDGTGVVGVVATGVVHLPSLMVDAAGTVRIIGRAGVSLPGLVAAGHGYIGEVATAALTMPMLVVSATGGVLPVGTVEVDLPALVAYGKGTVAEVILAVASELSILAFSKYSNYRFNSMCKFGDAYLGCTDAGIFSLDSDDDDGSEIDAYFEPGLTDFELVNQKRIRKLYVGGESKGKLKITTKNAEGNAREYAVDPWRKDQRQVGTKTAVGRDGKSRYWGIKLENVDGCYFAVDSIGASVVVLAKKPRGEYNYGAMILPMLSKWVCKGACLPMFTVLGTGTVG